MDDGEQCDCGSREECDRIDPCCDPVTCRLKLEADCATGPCCDNCRVRYINIGYVSTVTLHVISLMLLFPLARSYILLYLPSFNEESYIEGYKVVLDYFVEKSPPLCFESSLSRSQVSIMTG